VHENVLTGAAVDLTKIPIPKYSPDDGGPCITVGITAGIVASRDPETGVPDIGHYRFELIDRTTLSFNALPNHRLGKHIAKARALGHTTYRAAIVIGVDPLLAYACPIQVPPMTLGDTDDYAVAGGPPGVAGRRPGRDHEGKNRRPRRPGLRRIRHRVRGRLHQAGEGGPAGRVLRLLHPGGTPADRRVTAITHRNGAVFQALLTGVPPTENHILKQLS
jgi:4-hydroxy-3-polyprenylbenzoate decarboxylase/2,5-furandicarboxylate decarboxylase 1